jgi:hypothetical protein
MNEHKLFLKNSDMCMKHESLDQWMSNVNHINTNSSMYY